MSLRRRLIFGVMRLAAVGAVALGEPPAAAAPSDTETPEGEPFPAGIDADVWNKLVFQDRFYSGGGWAGFKGQLAVGADRGQVAIPTNLPAGLSAFLSNYLAGRPTDAGHLRSALDAAEAAHLWDARLVGLIWEASAAADPASLPALYGRLERHARVAAALTLAAAEDHVAQVRPWMSKAAMPSERWDLSALTGGGDLLGTARRLWPTVDAGPWRHDFRLSVAISGAATVHRAGRSMPAASSESLGRLDVLTAGPGGARVAIPGVGDLVLPEGARMCWWNAHSYLDDPAREALRYRVQSALGGDPASQQKLYELAWVAWPIIEEEAKKAPDAPGAAGLRLLTALYRE